MHSAGKSSIGAPYFNAPVRATDRSCCVPLWGGPVFHSGSRCPGREAVRRLPGGGLAALAIAIIDTVFLYTASGMFARALGDGWRPSWVVLALVREPVLNKVANVRPLRCPDCRKLHPFPYWGMVVGHVGLGRHQIVGVVIGVELRHGA